MSVLGSVSANLNMFILPSLFFIKFTGEKLCSFRNLLPFAFIILGVVFMFSCNIYSIIELYHHNSHSDSTSEHH
jgi:hypothetical protein